MNQEIKEILLGFKRSWQLVSARDHRLLIAATILMAASGVLTNIPAVILGRLVDRVVTSPSFVFSTVLPFLLIIAILILVREALNIWRKYLVHLVTTLTDKHQTVLTIEHLLKTDLSALGEQQVGALNSRVFRSIRGLIGIIKLVFMDFLPIVFGSAAAIIIALSQKPLIASVMILVIPSGLFIILKQIASQKGIRVSLIRGKEKIDGSVVEMLGGIETIRSLNTYPQEVAKIEVVSEKLRMIEMRHHLFMSLFDAAKYLNEAFFYITVITLAILLASIGVISKGDILVYSVLYLSISAPLREIHRILDQAHEGSILVNDLYELHSQPIDESFTPQNNQPRTTNFIDIRNLSFSYGETEVLTHLNLSIRKGEKIGIAGKSGCGKSTLIKILLRLVHNYSGRVELLGKDLKSVARGDLAAKIAYLPQKTYVFSGSIRDNLTYGVPKDVSEKRLIEACRLANLYDEVKNSLGGFSGKVTESGNNLSGGQRQRIALARLVLLDPDILIFDEATSALDNSNEAAIQKNLEQIFADKTWITIAHRLSTLRNSDRILVFDHGKVIQEGTFKELEAKPGLFKEFLEKGGVYVKSGEAIKS